MNKILDKFDFKTKPTNVQLHINNFNVIINLEFNFKNDFSFIQLSYHNWTTRNMNAVRIEIRQRRTDIGRITSQPISNLVILKQMKNSPIFLS